MNEVLKHEARTDVSVSAWNQIKTQRRERVENKKYLRAETLHAGCQEVSERLRRNTFARTCSVGAACGVCDELAALLMAHPNRQLSNFAAIHSECSHH